MGVVSLGAEEDLPTISYTSNSSCTENTASISFSFEASTSQDSLVFSVDGGTSYPLVVAAQEGTASFQDLSPGIYLVYARWVQGKCPVFLGEVDLMQALDTPKAFFTLSSPSCEGNDGIIEFNFEDNPSREQVAFSLDGGITFPLQVPDTQGSARFEGLEPGLYELVARWGGAECPTQLGTADLTHQVGAPQVDIAFEPATCTTDEGTITLSFQGEPGKSSIEFSLDGGISYSYAVPVDSGELTIEHLRPGFYEVYARWGSGQQCPNAVGWANLAATEDFPTAQFEILEASSCRQANGGIRLAFSDHPGEEFIEFSLDGGRSYPYRFPDDSTYVTLENISPGIYEIFTRWGSQACPVFLGTADIPLSQNPLTVSYSILRPTCGNEDGWINFYVSKAHSSQPSDSFFISLDGGRTYPFGFGREDTLFSITARAPGYYEIFIKEYGENACSQRLGIADLKPLEGAPRAYFTQSLPSSPDIPGSISFYFAADKAYENIAFSLDGGRSYPYEVADSLGYFQVDSLSHEAYDLFARWDDGACPLYLGTAEFQGVNSTDSIQVYTQNPSCGQSDGSLTITFPPDSLAVPIKLSIDEGNTYLAKLTAQSPSIVLQDLPAGRYPIFYIRDTDTIAIPLRTVYLADSSGLAYVSLESFAPTCGRADGSFLFNFSLYAGYDSLRISLQEDTPWLTVAATAGSFRIDSLPPGSYSPRIEWNGAPCVGNFGEMVLLEQRPLAEVEALEATCSNDSGKLTFSFEGIPYPENLVFSIDGGQTFPFGASDSSNVLTLENLPTGSYEVYAKWTHRTCISFLGTFFIKERCQQIGGIIWHDLNGNGNRDANEPGIKDIPLILLNTLQNPVASTQSDETGQYSFPNILPGTYFLSLVLPKEYALSPYIPGTSIFDPLTLRSEAILVSDSLVIPAYDVGLTRDSDATSCNQNIAFDKPAKQSSTFQAGEAALAVDGDYDGGRGAIGPGASISHTLQQESPWWEVDLQELSSLQTVRVFNRTDCCPENLENFHVFFSHFPLDASATLEELLADTQISHASYSGRVDSMAEISLQATGRFLRIQAPGNTALSLTELEAIGCIGIREFEPEFPNNEDDTVFTNSFFLDVYPVPATYYLMLELYRPDSSNIFVVELVDQSGRKVYKTQLEPGRHLIPVQGYSRGLYAIRVRNGNRVRHRRVILR